jgi:hypothetical protein
VSADNHRHNVDVTEPELHEPLDVAGSPAAPRQPLDEFTIHERLAHITAHLERLTTTPFKEPAWLRKTADEPRIPVIIAVLCAIALQAVVPHHLAFSPWWLMPALELLLLVSVIFARQTKLDKTSSIIRGLSLSLAAAASFATAWSVVHLARGLINGNDHELAWPLLRNGGAIWLTNVIVFALWYWDLDRGGPVCRSLGAHKQVDFLFTQMTMPELAGEDWEPGFIDYFYLSFTNATAFSPTDTLPMTRWAKMTMLLQSAISLVTVALVVARAVNIMT